MTVLLEKKISGKRQEDILEKKIICEEFVCNGNKKKTTNKIMPGHP